MVDLSGDLGCIVRLEAADVTEATGYGLCEGCGAVGKAGEVWWLGEVDTCPRCIAAYPATAAFVEMFVTAEAETRKFFGV